MITTASAAQAQTLAGRGTRVTERFADFLTQVNSVRDSVGKKPIINHFVEWVKASGKPIVEDSTVYLVFEGEANRVSVPSDLNGWSTSADSMTRLPGSNFFYFAKTVDARARFEYKFYVDSTWMLDPLNLQQAIGGHGPNSEIWMPRYSPPEEIEYRPDIPHGIVDTIAFQSRLLRRTHPVFIYKPNGYKTTRKKFPVIYVTDGGEYISLALMLNVLDNLIADKRIEPVVGVFMDPRTDIRDSRSSMRMLDYALSDTFVNAVIRELRPRLMKKYRLIDSPEQTAILGASLGGLIAAYAAYEHPEIFGLCAAQSPAFWWKDDAIIKLIESGPKKPIQFYIDTGTIRDAQEKASKMKSVLESKGYEVSYGEYPESHNWVNWRARLATILTYFWGKD